MQRGIWKLKIIISMIFLSYLALKIIDEVGNEECYLKAHVVFIAMIRISIIIILFKLLT